MYLFYSIFAMTLTSYELRSWHLDPEWHLDFDPDPTYCHPNSPSYDPEYETRSQISVTTQHSKYMPECVARVLHDLQVRNELADYELGIKPKENYEIYRIDDDYVIPF